MNIQMVIITSGIMGVEVPEVTRRRSYSGRQICQILGGSKRQGRKIVVVVIVNEVGIGWKWMHSFHGA